MDKKEKPGFFARLLRGQDRAITLDDLRRNAEPAFDASQMKSNPDADAALAKALLLKPDMTEQEQEDFRQEFEQVQARREAPGFTAARTTPAATSQKPQTPEDDPRHAAERAERLGEPAQKSVWGDKFRAGASGLKNLGLGLGAAAVGAHLLYKNSKAFRFVVKAATFPFWAYPLYTAKAAKAVVMNGPGGVGRVLGGVKSGTIGVGLLVKSALALTFKLSLVAFAAVVGMKTLTDTNLGRGRGLADNGINALSTTFTDAVQIGGGISRYFLPKAEKAYGVAEGAVISGADSIGGVISSGTDKVNGATNAVSECVSKAEDCGTDIGETAIHTVGNIAIGGATLWAKGMGSAIKHYYTTLPAFLWDNTVCNAFNCSSNETAAPAKTPAAEKKPSLPKANADKTAGKSRGNPAPAPVAAASGVNPLANLGYDQIGNRYVLVCTTAAMDKTGQHFPGMKQRGLSGEMHEHNERVGEIIEKMKYDPSSPLYRAVTGDKNSHVIITTSPFNAGAASAEIVKKSQRVNYVPAPTVEIDGVAVPRLCREWPMQDFLQGKGINPFKIKGSPKVIQSDVLAPATLK